MFQEKEMYFFEKHSRKVNTQKVVIMPKMTTGELLTTNLYDIIEENSRMCLFENNIFPGDMITLKNTSKNLIKERKQNNNYYFENRELCQEVGISLVLDYFYNPRTISCNLEEYLSKTDHILKKILASYDTCKALEAELINDITAAYTVNKIKYIGIYDFCIQSIEAMNFVTGYSFLKISGINRDLEEIKHVLLYRENNDIIGTLNKLMDCIIKYDDVIIPVTYCKENDEISEEGYKYQKFFIDRDDISEYVSNVRKRKNELLGKLN